MTQFTRRLLGVERRAIDLQAGALGLLVLGAFAVVTIGIGPKASDRHPGIRGWWMTGETRCAA